MYVSRLPRHVLDVMAVVFELGDGVLEGVAVLEVRDALASGAFVAPEWPWVDPARKLVVVTSHRRENFGDGFRSAMWALAALAKRPDVQLVYPVHRNPNVL